MTCWIVEVLVRVHGDDLTNDTLIELSDRVEDDRDWSLARWELGNGFWITTEVGSSISGEAADTLCREVVGWVEEQPFDADVVSVRAVEPEVFELEAEQPTVPELVSAVEAGEILGVSRQRVRELASTHENFPEPLYRLRTGPLWKREAIEAFDRRWTRKPGRPRGGSGGGGASCDNNLGTVTSLGERAQRASATG